MAEIRCETCPMRLKAEKNQKSMGAKIWKWTASWCPGWKAYQADLNSQHQ